MKKNLFKSFVLGIMFASLFCISCKKEIQDSVPILFEENPATITWDSSKSDSIDTFSANVSVYGDSNRRTGGAKLQSKYKMFVKLVEDKQYVRLDYPATDNITAKSVLTDGVNTLLVDTTTNSIEQKIVASPTDLKLMNDFGFIISQQPLSKISLSRIKNEVAKLALDTSEDKSKSVFSVELPSKYFSDDKETRLSTKISYDSTNELMETIETVTEREDGAIVTVTTCPVYEEVENGQIIKIGQYSIIETKSEVRYEGLEDLEYFNSIDSIPEMSISDYEALVEAGNAVKIEEFPLGNPADPSSIETIVELYDNIEINVIDDSVFKLIMEL